MIKRALFATVTLLFMVACHSTSVRTHQGVGMGSKYVFDTDALPLITINITQKNWNRLLHNIDKNRSCKKYVKADFIFNKNGKKETISNVGFRIRGGSFSRVRPEVGNLHDSINPKWKQAHFKINFKTFNKSRRFHRLRSLNLKMFNGDPALVREVYCMDLFQRFGVETAHRSSYTGLMIHVAGDAKPAYFGIYRINEAVDKSFLENRFPGLAKGYLWKCKWPADLSFKSFKIGRTRIGVERKHRRSTYELKTGKDDFSKKARPQLISFLKKLESLQGKAFEKWADKKIAVKEFLKAIAVNVITGSWDDYWANRNNFYIYFNNNGKFFFIPYDYDNTLGTCGRLDTGRASLLNFGPSGSKRPLIQKIFSIPRYKKMYKNYIKQLLDPARKLFDARASIARIQIWHSMIEGKIENDTGHPKKITDRPAGWGNCHFYRLLSGNKDSFAGYVNYFKLRTYTARLFLKNKKPVIQNKVKPITKKIVNKQGYKQQFPHIFLRGYFNNWGVTPMKMIGNYTWRGSFKSGKIKKYTFKFSSGSDWLRDKDWGDTSVKNDGKAELNTGSGKNINYSGPGKYIVIFNTKSLQYKVIKNK